MSIADKILQLKTDFDEVYDEGYSKSTSDFWDKKQRKGTLANYSYGFCGTWTNSMFYPKYNIEPTNCTGMFSTFNNNASTEPVMDLVQRLEECGVKLDTSKATTHASMFAYAKISHIGVIDTTSAAALSSVFSNARAVITIDKLILKADGSQTFSSTFTNCVGLKNVLIEGAIGTNIDFQHSPLSTKSIVNIIEHLHTTKSFTLTLKETAKQSMVFPYTSPETNVTYNSWDELIATRTNCTISLIQEG